MRTFAIISSILLGTAGAVGGSRLTWCTDTILLEKDGRATVTVRCTADAASTGDTLMLPYAFAALPESVAHSANIREVLHHDVRRRRGMLLVLASSVTAQDTLEYRFGLSHASPLGESSPGEFGNYDIEYRMVNASTSTIDRFAVTIALPEGFVITGIVSSIPPRKPNAASSPYAIGKMGERHCVTLTDSTVEQGDVAALSFQAKSGSKSPLLMGALVVLACAYLIAFRDLVMS